MKVSTNTVIRKHPADEVDLTEEGPELAEDMPPLEADPPVEQTPQEALLDALARGELDDFGLPVLAPPKVERQNAFSSAFLDPATPPAKPAQTTPPAMSLKPVKKKDYVPCCPALDAQLPQPSDLDLTTLGWLLAGTFLVGALTGVLGMRSVSSKVAIASVSAS